MSDTSTTIAPQDVRINGVVTPTLGAWRLGANARAIAGRFSRVYSVLILLVAWELIALALNNPLFLPRLSAIIATEIEMAQKGTLLQDFTVSLQRAISGFAIAVLIGVPLGLLMAWSQRWDNFWSVIISFTNPLPKIGLVPLFILWLGIGESSKIAVIAAGAVFPILINSYSGVRGVNRLWIWRARTMGANEWEILTRIVMPAALPQIWSGARSGMALAWVILVAAEMVAARSGLGFRVLYGQQMFDTSTVFAALLSIATIGLVFDRVIQLLSTKTCAWYYRMGRSRDAE